MISCNSLLHIISYYIFQFQSHQHLIIEKNDYLFEFHLNIINKILI